ncbi:MAG: FKBP-type peptidyl-prolyl cis-trans isomerase [Chitinophagaceae bacterium]|nr:FKBP-type peptidyl-prolyl cis-trans isomerase [Chitinophagaceae bacterium]
MKRTILLVTCVAFIGSAFSQSQRPAPKTSALEDTTQYALGVYMMQQLFARTGFVITNPTMFKKGIDDVIQKKKTMIDAANAEKWLLAYQDEFRKEKGRILEQKLFAQAQKTTNYRQLPSGVMYTVVKPGQGRTPSGRDTVVVNFSSQLPDGTVIEDANKSKQSYMILVSEMMPGMRDVILQMQEGAIVRALVPASQAYGAQGNGNVPPYSALVCDIALVNVRPAR